MVDTKSSVVEGDQIYRPVKIVVIGDGGVGKTSLIKWYSSILQIQLRARLIP